MKDGFIKVAAATIDTKLNDCESNANAIIETAKQASASGAKIVCFQELAITGYTLQDMFFQDTVLNSSLTALERILKETSALDTVLVVSLPYKFKNKIYDSAAVVLHGSVLGIALKKYLPNYNEFYDSRYFTPSFDKNDTTLLFGKETPIGPHLLFNCTNVPNLMLGVEICEDLWVPNTPSTSLCMNGATIIANPSASNEIVGKANYRESLVKLTSARLVCGYIYADTGFGESTGDVVYSGHNLIAENGTLLASVNDFKNHLLYSEIDVHYLSFRRAKMNTYTYAQDSDFLRIDFSYNKVEKTVLTRKFIQSPYLDKDSKTLSYDLSTIFECQVHGLMQRILASHSQSVVLGVSGGLDSALALLVCHRAFEELGLDSKNIYALSMPAFATTKRTRNNSKVLCNALNVSFREVDISATVKSHLKDLNHPLNVYDAAYENAQARCRTYLLMDTANMTKGIVIGTGDLSEIALGWSTYNGDQMSMYNVNASVPKTVVKEVVRFWANQYKKSNPIASETLLDILDTPITPELVPSKEKNKITQVTEDIIGPYILHDFFLYCFLRQGYTPAKIYRIANIAFKNTYSKEEIRKWLMVFFKRFFASQFKRSAAPDGVKIGSVSLSQRGDLRMPSDIGNKDFLRNLETELDSVDSKK